jgi:MoaA/NifB/PqqE/SkfB family radical SAM enzyme
MDRERPSSVPGGAPGPAGSAILQIHPSLRCNLSCPHCYSSSGPRNRAELSEAALRDAIADAAAMGYAVLSVSGGEPLMFRRLDRVLAHAKSLGLRTTVTTNGYFTSTKLLDRIRDHVDLLAISLDGPPEVHNAIRGSERAFERLQTGVDRLRSEGIPFGFIHTVTRRNWEHLLWVAEFAARNGAQLLQVHPLEEAGRAITEMAQEHPEEEVLEKVYVLASAVAATYRDAMAVQLDLLYRDHLRKVPALIYADDGQPESGTAAHLLGLIVLAPDGSVLPVSYGFSPRYEICNVNDRRLSEAWPSYQANRYPDFRSLCRRVWNELCGPDAPLVTNWHEMIVSRSYGSAA